MGLMILAILIGAATASGTLLLGGTLWLAFGVYALVGAATMLIGALALYLASPPAQVTGATGQKRTAG